MSLFVVLNIYTGSNIYLWIFFTIVCLGLVIDSTEHKIEYLIYFIPWVYTLKFHFTGFSLYVPMSALYVAVCIIYLLLWHNREITKGLILSYSVFAIYAITIPLFGEHTLTTTLGFLLNYTSILFAAILVRDEKAFGRYINIYALGLVSSSLVRLIGFVVPNINNYITAMTSVDTVVAGARIHTRFAGLDLDPNYFALQVLIAIACLLVKIYYDQDGNKLSIVLLILLTVFGLLSLSKMYIIMLIFLIVLTLASFFRNNMKAALKFLGSVLACVGAALYFTYDFLYEAFLVRFVGSGVTASAITTGRIEVWNNFIHAILNNPKLLYVGAGFGSGYFNMCAHNMYLTALYYMGIIGIVIILIFLGNLIKTLQLNVAGQNKFRLVDVNTIPLYVLVITNLSLDSFIMDYFPIHLLLVIFALGYQSNPPENYQCEDIYNEILRQADDNMVNWNE